MELVMLIGILSGAWVTMRLGESQVFMKIFNIIIYVLVIMFIAYKVKMFIGKKD